MGDPLARIIEEQPEVVVLHARGEIDILSSRTPAERLRQARLQTSFP